MKYKLIGLSVLALTLTAVILIGISSPTDNGKRYIEHIMAEEKTPCEAHTDDTLCSHLPIVSINTNDVEIPGNPIYDENEKTIGYTLANDGDDTISATLISYDNQNEYNHLSDDVGLETDIRIRVRGNSSRGYDKKGYLLRFINPDKTNNPQCFLGMEAHHEWALHGPFLDKSLIRNYIWYNIAGEIMEYSPNVRFCELLVNGDYKGVYLAVETITAGKDGARISLEVNKKDNSFLGYIIRLDKGDPNNTQNFQPFTSYSLRTHMVHEIVYPGEKNITPELKKAIKDDFSFFEKSLYSYDFDSSEYGYKSFIDVSSFVDYFLINELTCNYDAGWMSTYMYKDVDGKYKMCVWDFNSACDFYQDRVMDGTGFEMQNCLWYNMLFKDDDFIDRVIERYYELRQTVFSKDYLENFIDDTVTYLGDAVERNYEVWGYTLSKDYDMLSPKERNPENYNEAISQIKQFLDKRISWMDKNIEILRQYGTASKIKKFNENAN